MELLKLRDAAEILNISYKALLYKITDCGLSSPSAEPVAEPTALSA